MPSTDTRRICTLVKFYSALTTRVYIIFRNNRTLRCVAICDTMNITHFLKIYTLINVLKRGTHIARCDIQTFRFNGEESTFYAKVSASPYDVS